MIGHWN
jgi:hypothetical protein